MAKIPSDIDIDIDVLADLMVAKLQEGFIGSLQADLITMSKRLDAIEAALEQHSDGTDGLRVALADWANVSPAPKVNKPE